jgi:DNA-binding response OmpR family regulator
VKAAVLVVEDDRSIRRMLERTLAAEGYDVAGVSDGGGALAAIERAAPDLLVLDLGLPGLDGVAVCRRLRDKGLALPILMLTARDGLDDRVAGLDAGADDYLVKPFAPEELSARVRALLRRVLTRASRHQMISYAWSAAQTAATSVSAASADTTRASGNSNPQAIAATKRPPPNVRATSAHAGRDYSLPTIRACSSANVTW